MEKEVFGRYYVADCEHRGDINRAISYVKNLGGDVIDWYWDGQDCGESYLEISLPIEVYKKVYKNTSFSMDADINDFIEPKWIGVNSVSNSEFDKLYAEMKKGDVSQGFEQRMPLYLYFDVKGKNVDPSRVIDDIVDILGEGTDIVATNSKISSNTIFYRALLTTNVKNITKEKMKKKIGDFALGNEHSSYLRRNNFYGDCQCIHPIASFSHGNYELLEMIVERVKGKKPLHYSNYYTTIEVPYEKYVEDNKIIVNLKLNENGRDYNPSFFKTLREVNNQ